MEEKQFRKAAVPQFIYLEGVTDPLLTLVHDLKEQEQGLA